MQPPRSILRSQEFAPGAMPLVEPLKAHPLLQAKPARGERWDLLQRGTEEIIGYFVATLRRTW